MTTSGWQVAAGLLAATAVLGGCSEEAAGKRPPTVTVPVPVPVTASPVTVTALPSPAATPDAVQPTTRPVPASSAPAAVDPPSSTAASPAPVATAPTTAEPPAKDEVQFLAHTQSANHSNFDMLDYGQFICEDLTKKGAHTKQDLSLEIIKLSNTKLTPSSNGDFTIDQATIVANGAVTYLCPQFVSLAHG